MFVKIPKESKHYQLFVCLTIFEDWVGVAGIILIDSKLAINHLLTIGRTKLQTYFTSSDKTSLIVGMIAKGHSVELDLCPSQTPKYRKNVHQEKPPVPFFNLSSNDEIHLPAAA